jgi:soluble lytic murein transglycosylase-like protein
VSRTGNIAKALANGCGKLPLIAALALVAAAKFGPAPVGAPKAARASASVKLPVDFATIDSVLAKRAPGLGLTLRQQLAVAIAEESAKAGYDPLLIMAVIDVESDFVDQAVSPVGARGLMQIMPATLYFLSQKEGLRLSREEVEADPALRVRLGVRYLKYLQDRFGGDLDFALMAYNAGPTRIAQAAKDRELDQFRGYPQLVRRDFRRFREGEGLGGDWALARRSTP